MKPNIPSELTHGKFRISPVLGFERGPSVFRFEPSGIIKIGDTYHVYYTRFSPSIGWFELFNTPNHLQIWMATSKDGWHWNEVGQVLQDSPAGSWHQDGKHAPHVIRVNGAFYMFYTAHLGPDYVNKRIGLAVADNPAGPFRHIGLGPLLNAGTDSGVFDSLGQDDSCVLQREDEFWWYFKGYGINPETRRPINNRLCLAISDSIEGPYVRCADNPVTWSHTGCLWPHGNGVAMLSDVVDISGNQTYPPCIQYSRDGIHFVRGAEIQATAADADIEDAMALSVKHWGVKIIDAGVYSPKNSYPEETEGGMSFGLCQLPDGVNAPDATHPERSPFIVRFDYDLY